MPATEVAIDATQLQVQVAAFVRAFGLLQPERTPCGRPVAISEAHAIAELDRDGPLPQHQRGARLRLEKSTVSRLVHQLEDRGWLARSHDDSTDGRLVWLELTDAGREAAADLASARAAMFAEVLDAIPDGDRDAVMVGLQALVEALGRVRWAR